MALERILIQVELDDLWFICCRQQLCHYPCAYFHRILFLMGLLFTLLASIVTVAIHIIIDLLRLQQVLFLVFLTFFLYLVTFFSFTVIGVIQQIRLVSGWVWGWWLWPWVQWFMSISFSFWWMCWLYWIISWSCWWISWSCQWRGVCHFVPTEIQSIGDYLRFF